MANLSNGPTFATDLRALPGSNIALDFGGDDTISFAFNQNDMTVTIHGGNDLVVTGSGNDTIFDNAAMPLSPLGSRFSGDDEIHAGSGFDTIFAGDGHNIYDGGINTDTIDYSRATVGATVDLTAGTGQANGI